MARRRATILAFNGQVPEALTDHRHPLWRDYRAFVQLCDSTGVRPAEAAYYFPSLKAAPWWARFEAYKRAWCTSNDLLNQWGNVKCAEAEAAGIDMTSTSRYRLGRDPYERKGLA